MVSDSSAMYSISELEAQLNTVTDLQTRIDLLNELAWKLRLVNKQKTRVLAEEAYQLVSSDQFAENTYLPGLIASLRTLGAINNSSGAYNQALSQSLRAMELLGQIPEDSPQTRSLMSDVLGNIGWTYRSYGDYGIAAEHCTKGIKIAQELGDRKREARLLGTLSVIYAEANDLTAALEIGQKSLACYQEDGYVNGECVALNNLAMTYHDQGESTKALETGQECLRLARENGIDVVMLTALNTMGEIYLGIKDFARAKEYLLQALSLARENKDSSEEFLCLLNLGKVHLGQENNEAAFSTLQNALTISQTANDRPGAYKCYQLLSEIYKKQRDFETALQHYQRYHEIKETIFNENASKRLDGLKIIHQVETAKRDAEIHYLKTIELNREIEERKNTQASLEKLAAIDPLTGLLNRREFFNQGEREFDKAQTSGQPLTAILLDLDNFKQINDSYGHAIGDQVLIQMAKIIREYLRQSEIIGRYGGDEFMILLPNSASAQGQRISERLQEKIVELKIDIPEDDLVVTLSLGIADLKETKSATLEMLLECADQALYTAKRAGRNQIAVSPSL
jgi:diguanylate cyclase (GGDEF)-like protein